jgi:antitoxin ParD1/3/4
MNVSLTPELEQIVSERLASGLYNSASEVVQEALSLLQQRDELRRRQLEQLREEVKAGAEQIKQGRYSTYSTADELIAEIIEQGQQRLAEKKKAQSQ